MSINGPGETIRTASQAKPEGGLHTVFRAAAPLVVLAGAGGSLGFLLGAARRTPRLLLVLFVFWVLSPFMALAWAYLASKRWPAVTRATLYTLMLVLTLGSLVIYAAVTQGFSRVKPAAVFLLVPLASWLLAATVVPIAALVSRRQSRRGDGA